MVIENTKKKNEKMDCIMNAQFFILIVFSITSGVKYK